MRARIELSISSDADLDVRDIVDLMHDSLQATHNIKIEGIIVDKEKNETQLLSEEKEPQQPTAVGHKTTDGKYGPGTIVADDGQGQKDSIEEFPPDNNLRPVAVGGKQPQDKAGWSTKKSSMTDDPSKHTWNFGTKWI